MTADVGPTDSFGGWAADAQAKRDAWSATTPSQRLAWLEESLTFARDVGALKADRAGRAAKALRWAEQYGADVGNSRRD